MQRERHESEILKRLQPDLGHKTSLCEQKTGRRNPDEHWVIGLYIYKQVSASAGLSFYKTDIVNGY